MAAPAAALSPRRRLACSRARATACGACPSRAPPRRAGRPSLVTTWSDGENGGWFRQTAEEAGFFGHFFAPFVERVRAGQTSIHPVLLSDYLQLHPPDTDARVNTGAWNVATTSGQDFSQWAGSEAQRGAIEELFNLSRRYWRLARSGVASSARADLDGARHLLLEGETSCYLFWGDAWVPRLYERTRRAGELLDRVDRTQAEKR